MVIIAPILEKQWVACLDTARKHSTQDFLIQHKTRHLNACRHIQKRDRAEELTMGTCISIQIQSIAGLRRPANPAPGMNSTGLGTRVWSTARQSSEEQPSSGVLDDRAQSSVNHRPSDQATSELAALTTCFCGLMTG